MIHNFDMEFVFHAFPMPGVLLKGIGNEYVFYDINEAYERLTSRSKVDLVGKNLFEAFPSNPNDPNDNGARALKKSLDWVAANLKPHKTFRQRYDVWSALTKKYETRYWDQENVPILNNQGKLIYILHTVTEVTELVESIRHSSSMTTMLLHQKQLLDHAEIIANFGTWELNLQTQKLYWSDGVYRICGFEPQSFEVTFEKGLSVIHPDDQERAVAAMQKTIAAGEEYKIYKRFITASGEIKHIISRGNLIRNGAKEPVKLIGVFQDITEQEQAQRELQATTQRLESLIQTLDGIFWESNAETFKFTFISSQAERILGYPIKQWLQEDTFWKDHIHPDDREIAVNLCHSHTFTGTDHNFEYRMIAANGSVVWLQDFVTLVRENNKVIGLRGLMVDITQRKREEQRKAFYAEINQLFSEPTSLSQTLNRALAELTQFFEFDFAEAWLIGPEKKRITLIGSTYQEDISTSKMQRSFQQGEGLAGKVWMRGTLSHWEDLDTNEEFIRKPLAIKLNLKTAYGIPLMSDNEIIGVLILGLTKNENKLLERRNDFHELGERLGSAIKRKQLEQELREIFNAAPDVVCIAGLDGYFKKINPALLHLLEYTEEELLAVPFNDFIHPDDRNKTAQEVVSLNEGRKTFYFENRYITKSGRVKWLEWTASPAPEEGLIYAIARDVTEVKKLQVLLQSANSLARIGSWEVDLVNNTVYWSDMTREIHEVESSFTPDLSSAINFYLEGYSRSAIKECVNKAIQTGSSWDEELQLKTAKGNIRWVRAIGEAEFYDGKCIRLYGSFQDIHNRKSAEIEIMRQAKDLELSNAELEQFAYVASHDLQEPLRMVSSFLNLIEKKYDNVLDETGKQYIHFAVDGAQRMRQIILDLLEFSRVGRVIPEKESIDLNELTKEVVQIFDEQIVQEKAKIEIDLLPEIQAPKAFVRQIFQNLISNGLKYRKNDVAPVIKIKGHNRGNHWEFSIEDNGIGIRKEYYSKIFILFQRLHTRKQFSGLGMGLAICKKIVESLDGEIWVESKEGVGSTFFFTIPK